MRAYIIIDEPLLNVVAQELAMPVGFRCCQHVADFAGSTLQSACKQAFAHDSQRRECAGCHQTVRREQRRAVGHVCRQGVIPIE